MQELKLQEAATQTSQIKQQHDASLTAAKADLTALKQAHEFKLRARPRALHRSREPRLASCKQDLADLRGTKSHSARGCKLQLEATRMDCPRGPASRASMSQLRGANDRAQRAEVTVEQMHGLMDGKWQR